MSAYLCIIPIFYPIKRDRSPFGVKRVGPDFLHKHISRLLDWCPLVVDYRTSVMEMIEQGVDFTF